MKKMWKRFVSLLLACTLLAGMLPLSASAASAPGEDSDQYKYAESILQGLNGSIEEESSKYNLVGPVSLGDSELYTYLLTRYYIPDGTTDVIVDNQYVIVPGEGITDGNMPDYDSSEDNQPWVSANASAIYIAGGVTGIGRHAFNGMDTLEKVVFQDASDLTYVGSYAFNGDNKAQFTDEGNIDEKTTLDLSGVAKMGEYAFYNCDGIKGVELSGNIIAVETKEEGGTEEINHKIPNYAFGSCNALTSITVPEGIETIGTAAFAGCTQASSITLPDSLVTIGDRAFACSIDGDNKQLTALTIPENVVTIGASAFYGYTALTTVTVESTKLDKPGDAAFGNSAVNAYATTTTITDAESGITYEDVTVGTQFYTPNNAIKELFENEYNCYLGDLTPLEYAATVKATCEKNGYHVYRLTITSIENAEGQHPVVESRVTIPAVEHNYEGAPDRDATCTLPGYHVQVCTNKGNGLVDTCEAPEKLTPIEGEPRLGHSYTNITVKNPGIAADNTGDTVVTYTCANYSENEEENRHDGGVSPSYSWEIKATTLTASTTQTLGHLTLPAATGKGNAIAAELAWANGVNTEELLQQGSHDVQVKLKITGAPNQFADYLDKNFTIRVQVAREPLDFSKVEFQNATRYVGRENGKFEVIGMPTDTEITNTEYSDDGGKTWDTQAPAEDDADDQGKYLVRVTFKYDNDKYLISENPALRPGKEYTLEAETAGTGTITGTYEVRSLTAADLKATTINGLVYDTKEKATVRVEGLPKDAKVEVVWTENGQSQSEEYTATNPVLDVAYITNAGEYDVTITVTHGSFDGDSATVTAKGVIAKQTVETPVAKSGLDPYTPTVEQTGVPDSRDESIYTITGNKAIDAGTHTATAELVDKNNYKWSRGDEQETGTVTIPFTILKHSLQKPVLSQTSYVFDNQEKAPLTNLNEELTYTYDTDGKLSATWKLYPDSVAYTATNAQKTDAETYKVTVALSDPQNYQWTGGGTDSYDLTWSITPMQVIAPTVTVTSPVTYDGQPYNSESKEITFGEHSENSGNILKLGSEHKYYRLSSGGTALSEAPTNAGTYYVEVDFGFEDGLKPENYTITGNDRRRFTIEKAELTLTAPTENLSVTYTGSDLTVPAPQVEGLQKDDTASDYSLVYTYTIGESEVTQRQTGELKLSQVGTYHISVSVSRECTNYTSNTVEYVFTISTANQTVKLTGEGLQGDGSEGKPYTISKTLGDDPFTVTGKGYVGENETNAKITYAVTQSNASDESNDAVVEVGPTSGQVTLLRAGSATITVTAAGSANYQAATASYTITVGKGTPTVEVQMPEDGSADNTYPYTGKELSFTATVTGAGNGAVDPTTDKRVTYNFYSDNSGQKGNKIDSQPTKIGTYWVEAVYAGDDNYNPKTSEPVQFTISPAALKVEATGYSRTYDGGEHDPASITVTGVNGTPFTEDDYTVSYIEKGSDGEEKPGVDDPNWDSTLQVKDVAHSGDYWIKVVIDGDDSSYAPYVGKDPITVTINPRPLKIERKVTARKPYDGKKEATVEFKTINTGVDGETVKVTDTRAEYNSPNVEHADTITITYKLTAEDGTNLANYSLDGEAVTGAEMGETVTEGVGITPASITVAINDQTSVYDGEEPDVAQGQGTSDGDTKNWYVSEGTIYNSDNLGITLSIDSDSDAKDAGAYAIIGKWTNSNYTVTFTGNWKGEDANEGHAGTYTIDPRPISVQIGNADGFYGDAPDVTLKTKVILTPETAQGEEAGLVNGENIYGALEGLSLGSNATVSSSVGENYTIYPLNDEEPVLDDNGTFGNYNVTFTNEGTYTVKQRPITITIEDQESDYGCEIAKLAYSETLSNTYTGTNENVVFVGDDETDLKIALSTTANKSSDAGAYSISGKVTNTDLAKNYAITWKGETPYQENAQQATYTVEKADLAVEFTNEEVTVSMGGTVNNPLKFINQSNSDEELGGQPQDVTVKYSSNDQGVATVNETTGEITLVGTGNATITAEVTSGGKNFTEGAEDSYIIHVAEDGGLLVTVTPKTLTYTGEMQNLISYSTAPAGAEVTFKVEAQTEGDRCQIASDDGLPQGQDAGTYRVSWVAKLQGYRDATGSTTVTIAKASPTTGFSKETVSVPYEENGTFDSTEETTLNVADDYKGTITYMSNDTRVASVQGNSLENISLNGTGSATITAVFTETDNYTAATASFRITVGTAETTISYTAEDYSVEYDRIAHGSKITVKSPSEYTIMYSDNNGTSYDLNESPTITDAGDLTIYFQIQADGYNSASGTQKVTVEPKEITANMVTGIAESYTYTGKEITFDDAISVHDEGVLLEKDKDYTITYGDNKEVGKGSVTITGTGNYKESVTKNFTISPVDASDLSASLNRTFGYYRNSENNNATVTVTHGSHTVDSSEITLTVTRQDSTIESGDVVQEGLKLTFNKAGIYTIHVVVSGTHKGAFDLTYTLLPQDVASDGFQVAADPVDRVWTYDGENRAFGVTVTSGGTSLQKGVDFTLRYTYLPYVGSQEENEYDPESTEFTEAGIYTVIVEGTGNYTGHAELVALIQPRDLSDAGVTATFAQTELVYNGEAQEPGVTLTYNGTAITQLKDTEYYGNTNAGEAQALSAAREDCNNFTGARVDAFTIEKKSLKDSTITAKADPEEYYYTGYPVTPAVTVTDSDRNVDLSIGADYTVSSDAVGPGKVTATVTGTGNYKDTVTVEFTILPTGAEPVETLNLTVTPSEWTWDNGQTKAAISVTFNGTELNDTDYQLTVSKDGETPQTVTKAEAVELLSAPGEYTITATGVGAYNGSTDTETVTIQKIQPEVTVTATPNSLSGGGKVTLTLKGENLPVFADEENLSNLLTATAKDAKNNPDLSKLEWETDEQTGVMTAELTLPNTSETYTFTLTFIETATHAGATDSEQVVVAQQIISGGGGGPVEDQPADPDDTGVSDWLNTKDHLAYLAGYPGGTFGPDQNMTRAEAAQMFYNLLLEKDVEITVEFEDVPADAWYAKPVNTLASLGILSGVGNGRFDPERSITRAEFTVIAMKFANTSGGGVNIFSDVNEDDWFYSAVVDSTQYGWINGYPDGTFRPEATITRAEVTVIVNHMLGRAADRPYVIAHEKELNTFGDVNRGHWGYFHIAEATNAHEYHTEDGTESWTGLS